MKCLYDRKFEKDFEKVNNAILAKAILQVITIVTKASSISEIPNIKKLKGHRNAFRIRIGDYRIGVFIQKNTVTFAAFDHRKDIYGSFP